MRTLLLIVITLAMVSSCSTLHRLENKSPCSRETPLGQSLCDE